MRSLVSSRVTEEIGGNLLWRITKSLELSYSEVSAQNLVPQKVISYTIGSELMLPEITPSCLCVCVCLLDRESLE